MNKTAITLLVSVSAHLAIATPVLASSELKDILPLAPSAPASQNATSLYPSFADIVEPLMPAVVSVYTTKHSKKASGRKTPFP